MRVVPALVIVSFVIGFVVGLVLGFCVGDAHGWLDARGELR